jgi:plasmid replication initiation protein
MENKENLTINEQEKTRYLATNSNDLVNARYSLGLTETRLFLLALSQISPKDEELKAYKIYINEFLESIGADTKAYDNSKIMKPITKSLISKVIEITKKDGRPSQFNLVSTADYCKDEKGVYVLIGFNTYIKADLIQLKEKFLTYDLRYVLPCKSVHSVRLYQLLKQYLFKGERIESVANLKYMFEAEKQYTRYSNFKDKIIIQAQKELEEKTDICFKFEEIKSCRTITHIKFSIYKNQPKGKHAEPNQPKKEKAAEANQPTPPANPLTELLISLGFNEQQTKGIIKQQTPEFIKENANILLEMQKNGKINTNIPAFSNGFKTDFRPVKSAHEVEQETKQQEAKQEAEKRAKDHADREAINQLGVKIYNETLVVYTRDFFIKNQDLNTEFIKEFETKYIKSIIGATLFERNPETAKMAFIQNKKEQLNLNNELIKIAESDGYLLSFDNEQWQAIKNNQEKLF